jgi:nucleoside-diphosphate-sugar epimerase
MTLKKIVEITISELTKKGFKPSIIVWRPETDYMGSHKVSCGKIANRLGWNPKVKFSEGIAKCIESFHP